MFLQNSATEGNNKTHREMEISRLKLMYETQTGDAASYPDDDGEQRPAAGGQVDVGIQQVLVQVGVW